MLTSSDARLHSIVQSFESSRLVRDATTTAQLLRPTTTIKLPTNINTNCNCIQASNSTFSIQLVEIYVRVCLDFSLCVCVSVCAICKHLRKRSSLNSRKVVSKSSSSSDDNTKVGVSYNASCKIHRKVCCWALSSISSYFTVCVCVCIRDK